MRRMAWCDGDVELAALTLGPNEGLLRLSS